MGAVHENQSIFRSGGGGGCRRPVLLGTQGHRKCALSNRHNCGLRRGFHLGRLQAKVLGLEHRTLSAAISPRLKANFSLGVSEPRRPSTSTGGKSDSIILTPSSRKGSSPDVNA